MNIPEDLLYSKEHEWVRVEDDQAVVGITDYAQDQLGDVVFVELPEVGDEFEIGGSMASLESVKAVSEVYSPVSGEVVAVNEELEDAPEKINEDPYGDGWIVRLKLSDSEELEELLSDGDYEQFLEEEEEG